jgi:hypothetical protein
VFFIPITVVRVRVTVVLKETLSKAEQLRRPFEKFVKSPYYSVYFFEKLVERCKECISCQGRYLEKTITATTQSSDSE